MPNNSAFDSARVSIVGCGKVGMSTAFSLLHTGVVNELVLHGRCRDDLIGEELDLEHALSFLPHARVKATEKFSDLAGSDIIIYCAGAAQAPGESRLDLADKNIKILESVFPQILSATRDAIFLIVANPVDILTYRAYQIANLPKGRIFGSGTLLDTARFRFHLSEFLNINPNSIHAYILGEHGQNSFPVLSSAMAGGTPLATLPNYSHDQAMKAYLQARDAAAKIIESKGATFYGIAATVSHLVKLILSDAQAIVPVSAPLHQYHGHSGVALSVPSVVGRGGVEDQLEVKLSWEENKQLEQAVTVLKQYLS